jgi:hypothetical protein
MFDAEKIVFERLLLIVCAGKHLSKPSGQVKLSRTASGALDLRRLCQGLLDGLPNRRQRDTGSFEQRSGDASFLVEQRQQQMFHINTLVASTLGVSRCRLYGFLQFDRHTIHIHGQPPQSV